MTKVEFERIGDLSASMERVDGIHLDFTLDKSGELIFGAERVGGIECKLTYTDRKDISNKYLEIEPEVLWVWPNLESLNDVYSNVTWHIN